MSDVSIIILVTAVAFIVSAMVYPKTLRFARQHDIVDNPNARKLQRIPVPVLGGVGVFTGIMTGAVLLLVFDQDPILMWTLMGMTIMQVIGTWDDMEDISAILRFLIEIALVGAFVALTDIYIDDFHGLWGIHQIEPEFGIPLSIIAGVGVINATNLIDGVDGYASGYGMMACLLFAIAFSSVWDNTMVCMALIVAGALLPFFMHNVFGVRSKMFMGDGGTLMLGVLMTVFVLFALSSHTSCNSLDERGVSLTGLTLAILCIPVFDTLRVMSARIMRGRSPFRPDKTHLHHLFIDMGFSHLGAALFILFLNGLVVVSWFVSYQLGASIDVQTYIVLLLGFGVTFGFYKLMRSQQSRGIRDEDGYPTGTWLWHLMCRLGSWTHREDKHSWRVMRWFMDVPMMKWMKY